MRADIDSYRHFEFGKRGGHFVQIKVSEAAAR